MIIKFSEFLLENSNSFTLPELQKLKEKYTDDKFLKSLDYLKPQELFNTSCKLGFNKGIKKSLESDGIKIKDSDIYQLMKNSDDIDTSAKLLYDYVKENKNLVTSITMYYLIYLERFGKSEFILDKFKVQCLSKSDQKYIFDESDLTPSKKLNLTKIFKRFEKKED